MDVSMLAPSLFNTVVQRSDMNLQSLSLMIARGIPQPRQQGSCYPSNSSVSASAGQKMIVLASDSKKHVEGSRGDWRQANNEVHRYGVE